MVIAIDPKMLWAIGLFEGEGSIIFSKTNRVTLAVHMSDEDVLRKFHRIVKVGITHGPFKRPNPKHKDTWRWCCTKAKDSIKLLRLWSPYLGIRRKEKAKEAILRCKTSLKWQSKHMPECMKGHSWIGAITYVDSKGKRRCRKCHEAKR